MKRLSSLIFVIALLCVVVPGSAQQMNLPFMDPLGLASTVIQLRPGENLGEGATAPEAPNNAYQETILEQKKRIEELNSRISSLESTLRRKVEEDIRKEERDAQKEGLKDKPSTFVERSEDFKDSTGLNESDLSKLTDARMIEIRESLNMPRALQHPALSRTTRKIFDKMVENRVKMLSERELQPFGRDFFMLGEDTSATVDQAPVPADYTLGPGDGLRILLWSDMGEESSTDVTVNPEGQIYVSPIGNLGVQGITMGEFEQMILSRLGEKYKHFKGQVRLTKVRRIQIYVTGEVVKPGARVISALATTFNALYRSGGPSEKGTSRDIQVIRRNQVISHFDLYKYFLQGDKSQDLTLENGDTIFVPMVGSRVKVFGEVLRPAIYELTQGKSLSDLLAMAGGVEPSGYTGRIKIYRWQGNQRKQMLDIVPTGTPGALSQFELLNGDEIEIEKGLEKVGNHVQIEGSVLKPGEYAVGPEDTISRIIERAGGLVKEETSRHIGQIVRKGENNRESLLSFDPELAVKHDSTNDLKLFPYDKIKIFSQEEIIPENRQIFISGSVRRPGEYIWREGMRVRDLILRAQGFTVQSSGDVEIARITSGREAEIKRVDMNRILKSPRDPDNILLRPQDRITVLAQGGLLQRPDMVILKGEVKRPGPYSLKYPGETLLNVIERAGGLTSLAFPEGTIFKRHTTEMLDNEHLKFAEVVQDDLYRQATLDLRADLIRSGANPAALAEVTSTMPVTTRSATQTLQVSSDEFVNYPAADASEFAAFDPDEVIRTEANKANRGIASINARSINQEMARIPINLEKIIKKDPKAEDVILRNGDVIVIPRIPTTISVIGAVVNPSNVLFREKKNVKYYIERVGGFTKQSDHSQMLVLRANGEVFPLRKVGKILRGDIVLVPPRPKLTPKRNWQDTFAQSMQIGQTLANFAVSYRVLVQNK